MMLNISIDQKDHIRPILIDSTVVCDSVWKSILQQINDVCSVTTLRQQMVSRIWNVTISTWLTYLQEPNIPHEMIGGSSIVLYMDSLSFCAAFIHRCATVWTVLIDEFFLKSVSTKYQAWSAVAVPSTSVGLSIRNSTTTPSERTREEDDMTLRRIWTHWNTKIVYHSVQQSLPKQLTWSCHRVEGNFFLYRPALDSWIICLLLFSQKHSSSLSVCLTKSCHLSNILRLPSTLLLSLRLELSRPSLENPWSNKVHQPYSIRYVYPHQGHPQQWGRNASYRVRDLALKAQRSARCGCTRPEDRIPPPRSGQNLSKPWIYTCLISLILQQFLKSFIASWMPG